MNIIRPVAEFRNFVVFLAPVMVLLLFVSTVPMAHAWGLGRDMGKGYLSSGGGQICNTSDSCPEILCLVSPFFGLIWLDASFTCF